MNKHNFLIKLIISIGVVITTLGCSCTKISSSLTNPPSRSTSTSAGLTNILSPTDAETNTLTSDKPYEKSRIVAYVTWDSYENIWDNGKDLNSEPSLAYITDLIGPAVVPHSTSDPYIEGKDGSLNAFSVMRNVATNHGLTIAPYLYMPMSELVDIISKGKLENMVSSLSVFLTTYNLDGVSLDVENSVDADSMSELIDAVYNKIHSDRRFIDVAGFGYGSLNVAQTEESKIRYVQVMCYDLWWYPDQSADYPQASIVDAETGTAAWNNAGWAKSKILMGIPFYGRTASEDTLHYAKIVDLLHPSDLTDEGIINGQKYWWGGKNTDEMKAKWVIQNNYPGVMIFDMGYDDLNTSYSLLKKIFDTFNSASSLIK